MASGRAAAWPVLHTQVCVPSGPEPREGTALCPQQHPSMQPPQQLPGRRREVSRAGGCRQRVCSSSSAAGRQAAAGRLHKKDRQARQREVLSPAPPALARPGYGGPCQPSGRWAVGGAAGGWRGGWEYAGARLCQGRVSDPSLCFPLGDMGPPLLCAPQAPPPLSWVPPTAPGRGTPGLIATPHSRGTPPQPHAAPSNKGTPHPSLPLPDTPQTHGPFCAPFPAPH